MKIIKYIETPYFLIFCYLFIIISGEHLGGFYALYILLALPSGALHSLLAVAGIAVLLIAYRRSRHIKFYFAIILNISGIMLMFLSIFFFFVLDKQRYNYGTFSQVSPMISLVATSLVAIGFIVASTYSITHRKHQV